VCLLVALGCDSGGPGSVVSKDDAIAACVRIGSCLGGVTAWCSAWLPRLQPDQVSCALAAETDCTAIGECLGFSYVAGPSCTPGETCDGDTLIECSDGVRAEMDCTRSFYSLGDHCVAGENIARGQDAACGAGTCTESSSRCDEGRLQICDVAQDATVGFLYEIDCTEPTGFGSAYTCAMYQCGGSSGTCDNGSSCDGNDLVTCLNDYELRVDCSRQVEGGSCFDSGRGIFSAYCGFDDACTPTDVACDGTLLTFCAAGEVQTVDCQAMRYGGCGTIADSVGCVP